MAKVAATKETLNLQAQLHSLTVCFERNAVQMLASFPPLYVRLSRGSQTVDSEQVLLSESSPGSCKYTARWGQTEMLPLSLSLTRDIESGEFGSKHVKFLLKIFSEGKPSHKTLASYTFDVASLKLSCLDVVSSSKDGQRIECSVGKNAASAISSVSLDVTFHYSLMRNRFAHSWEGTPPDSTFSHSSPVSSPSPLASPSPQPEPRPTQTDSKFFSDLDETVTHQSQGRESPGHRTRKSGLLLLDSPTYLGGEFSELISQDGASFLDKETPSQPPSVYSRRPRSPSPPSLHLQDPPSSRAPDLPPRQPFNRPFDQEQNTNGGHFSTPHQDPQAASYSDPAEQTFTTVPEPQEYSSHATESQGPLSQMGQLAGAEGVALRRLELLTGSGPYDRLSSVRVGSESPDGPPMPSNVAKKIGDKDESNRLSSVTESSESMSVDLGKSNPPAASKQKSKAKRLKGIFKLKGSKSKAKAKAEACDPNLEKSLSASLENGHQKGESTTKSREAIPKPLVSQSLEPEFELEFKKVVLKPVAAAPETLASSTTTDSELDHHTEPDKEVPVEVVRKPPAVRQEGISDLPDKVETLLVVSKPPVVGQRGTSAPQDRVHRPPTAGQQPGTPVLPDKVEPLLVVCEPPAESSGPPPKPKRRGGAAKPTQPLLPTTSMLVNATTTVSSSAEDSQISILESQEHGFRQLNGASQVAHEDTIEDSQVTEQASSDEHQKPPTQTVRNPSPQLRNPSPQLRNPSPQLRNASPLAVEAKDIRERSSSVNQAPQPNNRKVTEPGSPGRLRSFSASPLPSERRPIKPPRSGTKGSRIPTPENQPNRSSANGSQLARSDAFKTTTHSPKLVSRRSQESLDQLLSIPKALQESPETAKNDIQHGNTSSTDHTRITKALQQRDRKVSEPAPSSRSRSSSGSPTLGQEQPFQQERVKRMSVPNEGTAISSPYSQSGQQLKPSRVSKLLSGSTPVLADPRRSPGKKYSSTSDLSAKDNALNVSGNLVVRPVRSSTVENLLEQTSSSDQILHGLLRIKVMGVNLGDAPRAPKHSITDMILKPDTLQDLPEIQEEPYEGLFCVFTINGGNSRGETSTQAIIPRRPVTWEGKEEFLFYTNQTRQVFVMCRKTKLEDSTTSRMPPEGRNLGRSKAKRDACIGAAVLSVANLKASPVSPDCSATNVIQVVQKQQLEALTLPLQPKGSILLQTSFSAWKPSLKVSCKGTVTIQNLSGLDCNSEHDISCTIKIDSEFQDCTAVLCPEECATEGWQDEPIEFNAYCNMHCDIQVWAYSSEETEYWCGGCVAPLALALSEEDVRYHLIKAREGDGAFVVSRPCEKTITLPIEPQGILTLSFLLYPSPRSSPSPAPVLAEEESESTTSPEPSGSSGSSRALTREVSFSPEHLRPSNTLSRSTWKGKSLRRNFTIKKAGGLDLEVPKTYTEEPFMLQQENTDLKREVEFLREELRETKSKLAESEFFRERALMELKTLGDELQELKRPGKGNKKNAKQKNKK